MTNYSPIDLLLCQRWQRALLVPPKGQGSWPASAGISHPMAKCSNWEDGLGKELWSVCRRARSDHQCVTFWVHWIYCLAVSFCSGLICFQNKKIIVESMQNWKYWNFQGEGETWQQSSCFPFLQTHAHWVTHFTCPWNEFLRDLLHSATAIRALTHFGQKWIPNAHLEDLYLVLLGRMFISSARFFLECFSVTPLNGVRSWYPGTIQMTGRLESVT